MLDLQFRKTDSRSQVRTHCFGLIRGCRLWPEHVLLWIPPWIRSQWKDSTSGESSILLLAFYCVLDHSYDVHVLPGLSLGDGCLH